METEAMWCYYRKLISAHVVYITENVNNVLMINVNSNTHIKHTVCLKQQKTMSCFINSCSVVI